MYKRQPLDPSVPEAVIIDSPTPLAPLPEIVPDITPEQEIPDTPIPLAAKPTPSDNPKTGHSAHTIHLLQLLLILSACGLLIVDHRQSARSK